MADAAQTLAFDDDALPLAQIERREGDGISLERLGAQSAEEANLILSSTPPGLEAVLDSQLLPQRTPIKMPIKVGQHVVAVRKAGVEVWHQTITAEASSNVELNPVIADEAAPATPHAGANTGIDTPPSVFLKVTFTFCPTFTVSRSQSTMLVNIVTPSSSLT